MILKKNAVNALTMQETILPKDRSFNKKSLRFQSEFKNFPFLLYAVLSKRILYSSIPKMYFESDDLFKGSPIDFELKTLQFKRKRFSRSHFHTIINLYRDPCIFHVESALKNQVLKHVKRLESLKVLLVDCLSSNHLKNIIKYILMLRITDSLTFRFDCVENCEEILLDALRMARNAYTRINIAHDIFYEDQYPFHLSIDSKLRLQPIRPKVLNLESVFSEDFLQRISKIKAWSNLSYQSYNQPLYISELINGLKDSLDLKIKVAFYGFSWRDLLKNINNIPLVQDRRYYFAYRGSSCYKMRLFHLSTSSIAANNQENYSSLIWKFFITQEKCIVQEISSFFLTNILEIMRLTAEYGLEMKFIEKNAIKPLDEIQEVSIQEEQYHRFESGNTVIEGLCILLGMTPKLQKLMVGLSNIQQLEKLKVSLENLRNLNEIDLKLGINPYHNLEESDKSFLSEEEEDSQTDENDGGIWNVENSGSEEGHIENEESEEGDISSKKGSSDADDFNLDMPVMEEWMEFLQELGLKRIHLDFYGNKASLVREI